MSLGALESPRAVAAAAAAGADADARSSLEPHSFPSCILPCRPQLYGQCTVVDLLQ